MEGLIPPVTPAVVLSILVGAFHACLYVVIRGTIGKHLPLTFLAAMVGAYVGHLVGRLAGDPVQLGDYNVLWASLMAWVGIVVVAGVAAIRPARTPDTAGGSDGGPPARDTATTTGTGTSGSTGTGRAR